MKTLNFLYRTYFLLPNFDFLGKFGKGINRAIGISFKKIMDATIPGQFERSYLNGGSGINKVKRDKNFIVSLTSFPARIDDIWITIECILQQQFKPDRIILWLADEQFPNKKLPESLTQLKKRGLEIRFCDDLKAHKKYYYTMKEFPDSYVITLDDDLYYDDTIIENLVQMHEENLEVIVTNRAHLMKFNKQAELKKYRNWQHNVVEKHPSHALLQTGGAGTLFPPNSLDIEVFNKERIKELCPFADDIWLKLMAYKKGTKVMTNTKYNKDPLTILQSQNEKLVSHNVLTGGNDSQLKNVIEHYNLDLLIISKTN